MTDLQIVREIQADCERDALALDGKAFNGKSIAEQIGQTLAMLKTLAGIVERQLLADEDESEAQSRRDAAIGGTLPANFIENLR